MVQFWQQIVLWKHPRDDTKIRGNDSKCFVNSLSQKFPFKGYCGRIVYYVKLDEVNQMKHYLG